MIYHRKNTGYYLSFPMVDSSVPSVFKSGVSPVDIAYYKDGARAWTSLAITDTATEIGSTGLYELDLTASELNHDYVIIKFAVSGAADTAFLFNMVNNDAIVDQVWDEAFSGHATGGTFGKLVKDLGEGVVSADGSVNDVSATATSFVTNLTESADDFFNDKVLVFVDGSLSGQSKPIQDYNGTTKAITFDAADSFTSAPSNGDNFIILANHVHPISQIVSEFLTTQMTESYAADGVAPTLAQALMLIQQKLGDFSISGSTLTVKQLDGSTTAATYTLDDPANPTSITRAT